MQKRVILLKNIKTMEHATTTLHHIRGHQDEKSKKALTTDQYLNTIVDHIARNNATKQYQTHSPEKIAIYIGN